jgi:glycosyltransferase involved in cell wall biosynthesis
MIVFLWENFGPYHVDRLEAAAEALAPSHKVVGLEIAGKTSIYDWNRPESSGSFEWRTLFPNRNFEDISPLRRFSALIRAFRHIGKSHVFLCLYERPEIFVLAICLRLMGHRVYVMMESKFDDKPRFLLREIMKLAFLLPYQGSLVGGDRSKQYLKWYGFKDENINFGYDTLAVNRIRALAGSPPAPEGTPFLDRHFSIVARLIPKKNHKLAILAYAKYRELAGPSSRALHIYGDGPLEAQLRELVCKLRLEGIQFFGFVQAPKIASALATTLALILPSTEEQWGLVINEAIAMGVPILCSENVGARDLLVRVGVNGYIFESDNVEGLAHLMLRMATCERQWRRFSYGSLGLADTADARHFAEGVATTLK